MENQKGRYSFLLPIIICTTIAYAILFLDNGGNSMEEGIWALVVAIVGLLGSTWFQYVNSKKDIKPLSGVQATTSEMKPRIEHIDYNTKELTETVLREMYPDLKNIAKDVDNSKSGIAYIQKEFEYQKRLKDEYSGGLNKEGLTAEIDLVFERNATLESQIKEKSRELIKLQHLAQNLEVANARLKEQVKEYENELGKDDLNRGMSL